MTVPTWPTDLPPPTRSGYRSQVDDPRKHRSAEAGLPGYRRRWSRTGRKIEVILELSRAQKAVFDTFHGATTASGALPFWMPDPAADGWPLLTASNQRVTDEGGKALLLSAMRLCLFGAEMPQETIRGVTFRIAFPIVVMP